MNEHSKELLITPLNRLLRTITKHVCRLRLSQLWPIAPLYSQNLVNKMWIGVASQDKMDIRSCLPKLLLAQHKAVPYFIRNKLCKVIVDIGRQDWPMFYHDFFTNTLQVSPADFCVCYICSLIMWRFSKNSFYSSTSVKFIQMAFQICSL